MSISGNKLILDEYSTLPYLIFTVGKNMYGINSKFVRSIETLKDVTTITSPEPNIRGGVVYQNSFINLLDMRSMLGLDLQTEEFEKSVQPEQRIKEHEYWVSALIKSVHDRTDFTLTDDPHYCTFGRWYYNFKTDNNVLKYQLSAIEEPHEAIHATAKIVKKLVNKNNYSEALSVIDEMRATHYRTTLHILSHLREFFQSSLKEIYIIIDCVDYIKGIIVDSIVGVEYLSSGLQLPETMQHLGYIDFLGQRKADNALVLVINNTI